MKLWRDIGADEYQLHTCLESFILLTYLLACAQVQNGCPEQLLTV